MVVCLIGGKFPAGIAAITSRPTEIVSRQMSSRRAPDPSRSRARSRRAAAQRKRRTTFSLGISAVVVAAAVMILFWATGGTKGSHPQTLGSLAGANALPISSPPPHVVIATAPLITIGLPINPGAVTAIAFRSIPNPSAIALTPTGPLHQNDEGSHGAGIPDTELDVGAAAGTAVYSPVDGRIIGIYNNVIRGQVQGYQVLITPQTAPGLIVVVGHLVTHPGTPIPKVGSTVIAGITPLGQVIDLSAVESQDISQFSGDSGNHASIIVVRSAHTQ